MSTQPELEELEKYREKQRQAEQLKRKQANDQSDIEFMLEVDRQMDEMNKKA